MDKIPEWMESHPLTQKIKADHEAERIKARAEIVQEIEALQDERRAIPCVDDTIERIKAEIKKKEKEIEKLKAKAGNRAAKNMRRRLDLENQIGRLQAKLLENFDPRLEEEIQHYEALFEKLRLPEKIHQQKFKGERNLFAETEEVITVTNADSIQEALQYCRGAIEEIRAMKFDPEPDEARLKELRANIPNFEALREIVGTRTLPGSKTPDPFARFRSDDEIEWRKNRLFEKAKTLLKR